MTIVYPRELPVQRMASCTFQLDDNVSMSSSGKGLVLNRTATRDPCWRGSFATPNLSAADRALWSAWKKSLGGLRSFVAFDCDRRAPFAYPGATAPGDISGGWNGTATITSVNQTLGLSGLPGNYQVRTGDRVGIEQAGRYGYFEVLEDVTANGSGVATLTLAPVIGALLQGVFTTSGTARLWRPRCQFVLDWTSWREQAQIAPTPISFEALQIL